MKKSFVRSLREVRGLHICIVLGLLCAAPAATQAQAAGGGLGKSIYEARCVMCHGIKGDGRGFASAFVSPRPRKFTDGKFKFRSTETGSIPTDGDLERTVKEGLHATSMPDWKDFLGGDSLHAVVAYVKSFSPRFAAESPKPVRMTTPVASSPSSIEAGKKVFAKLQCAGCHGSDGRGKDAVARDLRDDWGDEIPTPNLTEPWTFRRGPSPQDVYLDVRTGLDGSPMPSYIGSASDQELWHLANYVASLARKPVWAMSAEELRTYEENRKSDAARDRVAYGRILVHTRCAGCHSTYDTEGRLVESMELAGGLKWSLGPYGTVSCMNLTSDNETGIGGWTDDEVSRAITKGIRKDGSRNIPFPMPWTAYANLTDDDLNAIIAYLRSLPPVYNKIPPPEHLNVFSYLWGKFRMLILHEDVMVYAIPGNSGTTKEVAR